MHCDTLFSCTLEIFLLTYLLIVVVVVVTQSHCYTGACRSVCKHVCVVLCLHCRWLAGVYDQKWRRGPTKRQHQRNFAHHRQRNISKYCRRLAVAVWFRRHCFSCRYSQRLQLYLKCR